MANCLNLKLPEIQTFQRESGLSDFEMQVLVAPFIEKHNRMPHYDEISGVNSSNYIKDSLGIKEGNSFEIKKGLDTYGVQTIQDLQILLNNRFSDQNIKITPLNNSAIIETKSRPSKQIDPFELQEFAKQSKQPDIDINHREVLLNYIEELGTKLGISVNMLSTKEIIEQGLEQQIPGAHATKAFVYNGQIFINSDNATMDSKVHELLHIFLGSIKAANPDIYYGLVQTASQFSSIPLYQKQYPNRTQNDFLEEVFVGEFAKYLIGAQSDVSKLDPKAISEVQYHVNRLLDTMMDGKISVSMLGSNAYSSTLSEVAKATFSEKLNNNFMGSMSLDNAVLHRQTANVKEELMRSNDLIEECS